MTRKFPTFVLIPYNILVCFSICVFMRSYQKIYPHNTVTLMLNNKKQKTNNNRIMMFSMHLFFFCFSFFFTVQNKLFRSHIFYFFMYHVKNRHFCFSPFHVNVLNCFFSVVVVVVILWTWKICDSFDSFRFTSIATHNAFPWIGCNASIVAFFWLMLDGLDENDIIPRRENWNAKMNWCVTFSYRIYRNTWNISNGTSNKYVFSPSVLPLSSSSLFVRLTIPKNAQMNHMSRHYHHQICVPNKKKHKREKNRSIDEKTKGKSTHINYTHQTETYSMHAHTHLHKSQMLWNFRFFYIFFFPNFNSIYIYCYWMCCLNDSRCLTILNVHDRSVTRFIINTNDLGSVLASELRIGGSRMVPEAYITTLRRSDRRIVQS